MELSTEPFSTAQRKIYIGWARKFSEVVWWDVTFTIDIKKFIVATNPIISVSRYYHVDNCTSVWRVLFT